MMIRSKKTIKSIRKYLEVKVSIAMLIIAEIVCAFGLLGITGSLENGTMTIGNYVWKFIGILSIMIFIGFIIHIVIDTVPYIKREIQENMQADEENAEMTRHQESLQRKHKMIKEFESYKVV